MRFVYPEFLWALLALVIPVIIHLFNFRRYKTLYFSSLQFIKHVEQRSKSTQKLKNLLVLFSRILAFTTIIFAFAQPYFNTSSASNRLGKDVLAIHIDNSFSMSLKGAEGELLSEAKESARKIISNSPLNIRILMSSNALTGIESRLTNKMEALDRLDKLENSPMVRSYDEVIAWQKNNLNNTFEGNNIGNIQHIYLSDFQKNTNKFDALQRDSISNYFPILLSPQNKSNLSIDTIWFTSPLRKAGMNNELNIRLTNNSENAIQNVQLNFELGTVKRSIFVDVESNASTTTKLSYSDKEDGYASGKLSVQDKQMYTDDDYYFSYTIPKKSKLLVINGENANQNVGAIYQLDNFYDVQEINQRQYTQDVLSQTNLVVLNGVNEVPSGLASNLLNYWDNGGTVAIFPGANINSPSFNSFLGSLKLPALNKIINQSSRIQKLNYKDPFFLGVFEKEKDNLSLPAVSKFYLTSESTSTGTLNIIQLQNGKPLFLRTDGEKQAFLYTSVLNSDYGSFTSDILFTTILLRIAELSMRSGPIAITIGETNKYPIYSKLNNDKPIHLKSKGTDFIPRTEKNNGVTYIDLSGSEAIAQLKAGTYTIESDKELGKIALNYNRKESKIASYTKDEIAEKLAERGIENISMLEVSEGASVTDLNLNKRYPYWKFFLLGALLFLIIEILLLKFWDTKNSSQPVINNSI
jgi:hypothetical protein